MFRPCVLIPVYNHEHAIAAVVDGVLAQGVMCILIDDGSSFECAQVLRTIAAQFPEQVQLHRLDVNQGKGAAVLAGFRYAEAAGFTHALQVDADGQHCVADIQKFLHDAQAFPDHLIVGYPIYDESVPAVRLYARYLTHIWVWINTLSFAIKDSMCGFRVYPIAPVIALINRQKIGLRMNFDTDLLVRLFWEGVPVRNMATRVAYPTDGVSHFRVWRDNLLITRMHATLFFGMLIRFPRLLARSWLRTAKNK
jgi:glycosyltransferase involved in cell wall biosynthesis